MTYAKIFVCEFVSLVDFSIEKDDQRPDSIIEEPLVSENVQGRLNSIDTELENSTKINKSKLKMKLSKNQSESNTKLRKQSLPPTVQ